MANFYVRLACAAALVVFSFSAALAQTGGVGIGTTAPDASAALDIASSDRGALLPRLTAAARLGIASPAAGLIVFQTDSPTSGAGSGTKTGFWYNGGTAAAPAWLRLTDGGAVSYDPGSGLQVGPGPVGAFATGTVGTGSSSTSAAPNIYRANFSGVRTQYLVTAAQLTAAGLRAGNISSVGLSVTAKASTVPYSGFTIQMANTAATTAGATFVGSGLTLVYSAATYTVVSGLNTHAFQTPFAWDGTSNVLLQMCYGNASANAADNISYFTTAYQASLSATAASGGGCALTAGTTASTLPIFTFTQAAGAYTLPAVAGSAGQVLTQQASGAVAFQTPQWTQNGSLLYPSQLSSNVGIGTSAPGQKLDVAGNANVSGLLGVGVTTAQQKLDVNGGILARGSNAINTGGAYLQWNRSGGSGETWLLNQKGGGNGNAGIRFGKSDAANAVTEFGRFVDNGNFGVGDFSGSAGPPTALLDVNGSVRLRTLGAGVVSADGNGNLSSSDPSNSFVLNQSAMDQAADYRISGNGSVGGSMGIGAVAAADTRLSISPSTTEPKITLYDGGSTISHYGFGVSSGQLNYHVLTTGDQHVFYATGKNGATGTAIELLRIQGNGRVGIGTTTASGAPTAMLDVNGSTRLRGLTVPGVVTTDGNGNLSSSTAASVFGTGNFIANQTTVQSGANFNVSGNGTVGSTLTAQNAVVSNTLTAQNAVVSRALTGSGASIGTAVGVGIRADGGLNLGQNTPGNSLYLGYQAGPSNTGSDNLFVGYQSGYSNTSGGSNLFWGTGSGYGNTTGGANLFSGYKSGYSNTEGTFNVFGGYQSGYSNSTGNSNTFSGTVSGYGNSSGTSNTFSGAYSGYHNTSGNNNTALGFNSGPANGSGGISNATALGANVSLTQSNTVVLGSGANVGIGTSSPTQKLDVNGGILAEGNGAISAQGAHLQWNRSGSGETWLLNQKGGGNGNAGIRFGKSDAGNAVTEFGRFVDNGNFGVGDFSGSAGPPTALLDVNGSVRVRGLTTAGVVTTDGNGNLGSSTIAAFDATTASNGLTENGYDVRLGGTLSQATTINQNGNFFSITGGLVGIGTTAPMAKLTVNGGIPVYPSGIKTYFGISSTDLSTEYSQTPRNVVAYFTGGQLWVNDFIVAGALATTSDRRIKHVIGLSNRAADLALLNRLRITDYTYIDQQANTDQVVKKVIAQEVQQVLPAAVSRSNQAIPNVYARASQVASANEQVTVTLPTPHELPAAGGRMRFYTKDNQSLDVPVAVVDARTVRFASPEAYAELFVYGKYVDDFLSVDYDALTTLNVSATQELARKVEALEKQNATLQAAAAQAAADHADLQTMKEKLARLLGEAPAGTQARK